MIRLFSRFADRLSPGVRAVSPSWTGQFRGLKLLVLGVALTSLRVSADAAASPTWIATANKTWDVAAAWSSGTAPGAGDTAYFLTNVGGGSPEINVLATAGGVTVANIMDSDTAGPVFFTPPTAGTYLFTVTGTFSDTATKGSTVVRNNTGGLLNFVGNVVSNSGGGNLEFGFNGASNPLNAYSATSTSVSNSSLTGFNVTGTAILGDVTINGQGSTLLLQDATTANSTGTATATSLSGSGGIVEVSANAVTTNTATLILTNSGTTATFNGTIRDGPSGNSNHLSVIMNGSGTQVLAGANTYTGATVVTAGSLLVSGALSGSTSVTVAGGATLGVGQAAGATSYGTLNVASLNTGSGSIESLIKLNLGGVGSDSITTGAFTLNGEPVNLVLTSSGSLNGPYTLLSWTSGGFTDVASQIDLAGSSAGITISELSISGNSLVFTAAAVPEPGSLALLGAGAVALLVLRRRRRAGA